ncbi:MAG: hypothetical protein U0930_24015 [Pirellulales bacterium]
MWFRSLSGWTSMILGFYAMTHYDVEIVFGNHQQLSDLGRRFVLAGFLEFLPAALIMDCPDGELCWHVADLCQQYQHRLDH